MIEQLRNCFFYEFEIANHNIVLTKETLKEAQTNELILVNQTLPFCYRHDQENIVNTIYDEKEYEFNERLVLKKIASFFVTLATTREPEKNSDLLDILQKWHDG